MRIVKEASVLEVYPGRSDYLNAAQRTHRVPEVSYG